MNTITKAEAKRRSNRLEATGRDWNTWARLVAEDALDGRADPGRIENARIARSEYNAAARAARGLDAND